MDFRREKLRLALGVLAVGWLISILYHGWQGWALGRGYPDNTFLFLPQDRYSDFTIPYRMAMTGAPYHYSGGGANYFPGIFLIFDLFAWLPPMPAAIVFLLSCMAGLFVLLEVALRSVLPGLGLRILATTILLWSFPFLIALDRGNTEIALVFLIGASLWFYGQKRFALSFWLLLPTICFKLYPAVLLLLFCRRRLFRWFFLGIAGFFLVSWLALLTFSCPVAQSCDDLLGQLAFYNKSNVMGPAGVAASASAWNPFRALVWLIYRHDHHQPEFVGQLPVETVQSALYGYDVLALVGFAFLAFHVLLVETHFARRALLLLLFMTVAPPGGGDYKLMYVGMTLVLLLLIQKKRAKDLVVTFLLAFCMLPKREVFLTFMGRSDTNCFDATIGVILNPLCMLAAMVLLMWDGWQAAPPFQVRRSFKKMTDFSRAKGASALSRGFSG